VLETFTLQTFAPHIGETFRLRLPTRGDAEPPAPFDLQVIEATDLSRRGAPPDGPIAVGAPGSRRAPFSIVFRGPPAPVLPQRIYHLEHGEIGALELFLVPVGPDGGGMRFEAVFT
jgi:hypothetical protein